MLVRAKRLVVRGDIEKGEQLVEREKGGLRIVTQNGGSGVI